MTIVAVVRPGWTDFDEQHRLIGSLDLPLNSRGETQLATLIERILGKLAAAISASAFCACETLNSIFDWPEHSQTSPTATFLRRRRNHGRIHFLKKL